MAEDLYTGPRFAGALGAPVEVAVPGAGLAGVPLPPVIQVQDADLRRSSTSAFLASGDQINYAPPVATRAPAVTPGAPNIATIDAKFAAVPPAPTRPTGGFGSDQRAALEYANAMHAHSQALDNAKDYARTAKELHDIHQEASVEIEAGDFLHGFSKVRADADDFEDQTNALLQQNPNSPGHRAVQEAIAMKRQARQNHYGLSKERDDRDEKSDQVIAAAGGAGIISDKDKTEPGVNHPDIGLPTINKNGSINRRNTLILVAKRQGAQKDELGETRAQAAERAGASFYNKQVETMRGNGIDENDAEFKQVKEIADVMNSNIRQRDHARLVKRDAAAVAAVTGPTGAAAPKTWQQRYGFNTGG